MLFDRDIGEAVGATRIGERVRLGAGPTMAPEAARVRLALVLDRNEPATGAKDADDLVDGAVDVAPVVGGREGPRHACRVVADRKRFGAAFDPTHPRRTGNEARDAQHDRRGVDARHRCAETRRVTSRDARTAPDVDQRVAGFEARDARRAASIVVAAEQHADRGDDSHRSAERVVVRMVIRRDGGFHGSSLTVEPNFKSSGFMAEDLLTIGEVAFRAGVATSTIRYYERRGLLRADARRSGQRQFRQATLRRLVFIGMLQDAGLALDDIDGILNAGRVTEWKAIARRRLDELDEEIAQMQAAREYLAGALLCRYDHPATECRIMGAEIDRRLAVR
jgi:DNA-binding transcriptional MerR regulator